ncbi:MAG TPA: hypothetical protein VFV73_44300 [Streptosporangiaceae bacterium]|nr:hypothetical protein [Streptosporangiaceae bacterium]
MAAIRVMTPLALDAPVSPGTLTSVTHRKDSSPSDGTSFWTARRIRILPGLPSGQAAWALARQLGHVLPAGPGKSQAEDPGADTFEIICRECGGDPVLGYREVSAELQQIGGPYTVSAGNAAFTSHVESCHGTGEI